MKKSEWTYRFDGEHYWRSKELKGSSGYGGFFYETIEEKDVPVNLRAKCPACQKMIIEHDHLPFTCPLAAFLAGLVVGFLAGRFD